MINKKNIILVYSYLFLAMANVDPFTSGMFLFRYYLLCFTKIHILLSNLQISVSLLMIICYTFLEKEGEYLKGRTGRLTYHFIFLSSY